MHIELKRRMSKRNSIKVDYSNYSGYTLALFNNVNAIAVGFLTNREGSKYYSTITIGNNNYENAPTLLSHLSLECPITLRKLSYILEEMFEFSFHR